MIDSEIEATINSFLVEEFEIEPEQISPEASLKDTLDLDSLDYVDLMVIIEGNFGFKVKQEDFGAILTFKDLYKYVLAHSKQTS